MIVCGGCKRKRWQYSRYCFHCDAFRFRIDTLLSRVAQQLTIETWRCRALAPFIVAIASTWRKMTRDYDRWLVSLMTSRVVSASQLNINGNDNDLETYQCCVLLLGSSRRTPVACLRHHRVRGGHSSAGQVFWGLRAFWCSCDGFPSLKKMQLHIYNEVVESFMYFLSYKFVNSKTNKLGRSKETYCSASISNISFYQRNTCRKNICEVLAPTYVFTLEAAHDKTFKRKAVW